VGGFWLQESSHVAAAWENEEHLYKATLENYPDNVEVMVNLSAFYLGLDRDADAARLLEEARRLSPTDINVVRNGFALLVRADQPQAALELLKEHPALMERSEFLIRKGEALQQLKRFPQARDTFEEAFRRADSKLHPSEWCAAGYGLAVARLQTGATLEQAQAFVEQLCANCSSPELARLRDLLR
jgi:tetratricopeptide (TPR) repeat protein